MAACLAVTHRGVLAPVSLSLHSHCLQPANNILILASVTVLDASEPITPLAKETPFHARHHLGTH